MIAMLAARGGGLGGCQGCSSTDDYSGAAVAVLMGVFALAVLVAFLVIVLTDRPKNSKEND